MKVKTMRVLICEPIINMQHTIACIDATRHKCCVANRCTTCEQAGGDTRSRQQVGGGEEERERAELRQPLEGRRHPTFGPAAERSRVDDVRHEVAGARGSRKSREVAAWFEANEVEHSRLLDSSISAENASRCLVSSETRSECTVCSGGQRFCVRSELNKFILPIKSGDGTFFEPLAKE